MQIQFSWELLRPRVFSSELPMYTNKLCSSHFTQKNPNYILSTSQANRLKQTIWREMLMANKADYTVWQKTFSFAL